MQQIINTASKQSAVIYNKGEQFDTTRTDVKHIKNEAKGGTVFRVYACGFNDGQLCLSLVDPRNWKVVASWKQRFVGTL